MEMDISKLEEEMRRIGKEFGYEGFEVQAEVRPMAFDAMGCICYEESDGVLKKVRMCIDNCIGSGKTTLVIAHEFAELEDSYLHPTRHKILGYLTSPIMRFLIIGELVGGLYDTFFIDHGVRKRGYKMSYWFHM